MNVHCLSKHIITIDQAFGMKLESKRNYLKMDFSYSRIREINNSKTPLGGNDKKRYKDFCLLSIRNHESILQEFALSSSQVTQGRF